MVHSTLQTKNFPLESHLGKIEEYQKEIDILISKRKEWERHLGAELEKKLIQDPYYIVHQKMLGILIQDPKEETYSSLLKALCMQIAESKIQYREIPDDTPFASIEWGAKKYTLDQSYLINLSLMFEQVLIASVELNSFLYEKMNSKVDFISPTSIEIRIFPGVQAPTK